MPEPSQGQGVITISSQFSTTKIGAKRLSEESEYSIEFDFTSTSRAISVEISQFIACTYDDMVWIGVAIDRDDENEDINIKFLHPSFPSTSYHWPQRDDACWVPKTYILCIITAPTTATGRQYHISKNDEQTISKLCPTF